MLYIPYGQFQINSKLKVDEIKHRLKNQIEPQRIISVKNRGTHKYFQGNIENRHFKINRIIRHRNPFKPVIIGEIQPETDRTIIDLSLRIDYGALAILAFVLLIFQKDSILQLLQTLFVEGSTELFQYFLESSSQKILLSAIKTFSLFYLFVMILFNVEASRAIKYLDELFENQLETNKIS